MNTALERTGGIGADMYLENESVTPVIDATLACYRACLGMAKSGREVPPAHLELLTECAGVGREAAHQLIGAVPDASLIVLQCADISDRCAEACERLDGMEECGAVCRWCAAACRDFAS
jgi:hypothetical protein